MALADERASVSRAIHSKYGEDDETEDANDEGQSVAIIIRCPARGTSLRFLRVITLNRQRIATLGDVPWLQTNCQSVSELDLACNAFSDWQEVFGIFTAFPRLGFLNLTDNPLDDDPPESTTPRVHSELRTLILNKTSVQWKALDTLLSVLEGLQELHISMNGYNVIELEGEFPQVKRLHVNENPLVDINNLGNFFPRLEILVAHHVPVDHVTPHTFQQLQTLSISHCAINDWRAIEALGEFASLNDVKLQGIPLTERHEEDKRRHLIIAALPNIARLNGSPITEDEREESVRQFIRFFSEEALDTQPFIYKSLVKMHGTTSPLANVDMTPATHVTLWVVYEDLEPFEKRVSLKLTAAQLKREIAEEVVGLPPEKFDLIYVDLEDGKRYWSELMNSEIRQLFSYKMKDNDRLEIRRNIDTRRNKMRSKMRHL